MKAAAVLPLLILAACAARTPTPPIRSVAFGSCALQWEPQPILDTRTFRGPFVKGTTTKYAPNPDSSVTLLGEAQWAWLEAQLAQPADLRFLCSSTQIVVDSKGMDEWGCFPHERKRLLELVAAVGPEPVLLLTGNVHFTEVSATEVGGTRIVDFTSSGMTHVNPEYAAAPNPYRVAGPRAEKNFGLVEIDWAGGPSLTLKAISIGGSVHFEHTIHPGDSR